MLKKKWWMILVSLVALVVVSGLVMFVLNSTPIVPTVSLNDPTTATRPFVVKIHAQWCPVCMLTKGTWTKLQKAYSAGVNLVVFDVTNKETTEASRAEAKRLGLEAFFEAHSGDLGSVYILDGVSKEVKGSVSGSRNLSEYAVLIDEALKPKRN
jgi:thiol-disulfide isomerase/thioredoxin